MNAIYIVSIFCPTQMTRHFYLFCMFETLMYVSILLYSPFDVKFLKIWMICLYGFDLYVGLNHVSEKLVNCCFLSINNSKYVKLLPEVNR